MLTRSKLVTLLVCLVCWPALAWGQQEMRSASKGASTPLPITGSAIDADHNALDVKCLSGCSGSGGGGDATAANQTTMIGHLATIATAVGTTLAGYLDGLETLITSTNTKLDTVNTNVDGLEGGVGAAADAAVTTNATGSLSAKLRGIVAILADIWSDSANAFRFTMVDSSGNEIVVPTAGLTSYTAAGASTNATNVKNAAGTVYGYSLTNTTTTIYYLRMYNLASAPTCSSATGYVSTIPIPPAAASGGAGGREIQKNIGQAFTTGVGFCITGGASSTDNTSAATGVFVEILYK